MSPLNGFTRRLWTGIAAGVLVVAVAGCGSPANKVEVKKTAPPSPRKVVLASVRATAAAKSARLSMRISTDSKGASSFGLTADGVTDFTTGNGTLTMRFTGPAAELFAGGIEIRTVDGEAYLKMPESLGALLGGGKWLKTPDLGDAGGTLPGADQSDPSEFLAYLQAVSNGVKKVGTESIRGVSTTHYTASLDLSKAVDRADVPASLRDDLKKLTQKFATTTTAIPAEVWVDDDGLARRIQLKLDLSAMSGEEFAIADLGVMTMELDLYDFGVPVNVVAPPPAETTDLPSFGPSGPGGTTFGIDEDNQKDA